jgi:hypothetical protein
MAFLASIVDEVNHQALTMGVVLSFAGYLNWG